MGLCVRCNNKVEIEGHSHCPECKEKDRVYAKRYSELHKEIIKERRKKYRNEHHQEYREKENKRRTALRATRIKQNKCLFCNEPAVPNRIHCIKCLYKSQLYQKRRRTNENWRIRGIERKHKWIIKMEEEGRCNRCGGPLLEDDGKSCMNCSTSNKLPKRRVNAINYQTAT